MMNAISADDPTEVDQLCAEIQRLGTLAHERHVVVTRLRAEVERLTKERDEYGMTVSRIWAALGCEEHEDAKGMAIWELVSEYRRRGETDKVHGLEIEEVR